MYEGERINEIVSVQSEESILQKTSEEIKKKLINSSTNEQQSTKEKENKNETNDDSCGILREKLENQVKTGEITPFQAVRQQQIGSANAKSLGKTLNESTKFLNLEKYIRNQEELAKQKKLLKKKKNESNDADKNTVPAKKIKISEPKITKKKKTSSDKRIEVAKDKISNLPANSHCCKDTISDQDNNNGDLENNTKKNNKKLSKTLKDSEEEFDESGSEYVPSDDYDSEEVDESEILRKREKKRKNCDPKLSINGKIKRVLDDGDEDVYRQRVKASGYKNNEPLHKVDNIFKVPKRIWRHLYKYQKVAVKWLWELHTRNLGGLLGDEMGLGKTVQVIGFLAGLDCSDLLTDGGRFRGLGPTLIICPATLLEQWVQHFHEWWPCLRIVMLHHSSTFEGDAEDLLSSLKDSGVLVVSYTGVLQHRDELIKFKWHYVILDEGHKIRNPEAKVTKVVKRFLTPHRLLLSGSPMQNSLKELWSLFDFILPGKLGTLQVFMEHCAGPITRGGYTNATRLQEVTALQVATMLKNAINPYMLRRTKSDVQSHVQLPDKNEQVLFCVLTDEQKSLYQQYLKSDDVAYVLHEKRETGRYRARLLVALTALRKLCNHPDLFLFADNQVENSEEEELQLDENEMDKFGHWKRAGKMTVVRSLLKIWKKQGHRVLLFTQSKQMMNILEILVQREKYTYLTMNGMTPMNQRQLMISKFNKDPSFFVFLLTTRVGGLGINLTGADRIIIYDPDWNPATDCQAKERAWRIGQDKNVTVYRLITAGTIEEKIYHRQIFKILLSNKVLEDPRQRRLFHTTDLTELFHLNEPIDGGSESDRLFRESKLSPGHPNFTQSKIEQMKKLASTLSKKISAKASVVTKDHEKDDKINDSEKQMCLNDIPIEKSVESDCDNLKPVQTDSNDVEDGEILEDNLPGTSFKLNENCNKSIEEENLKTRHSKKNKKHKKTKSKEDKVSALFEGEKVSCLIGRRLGQSSNGSVTTTGDDDYILSKLFSKSAVSSAFQHESILSNAVLNPEDETPLQRAAKESAFEKMDNIRKSRKYVWKPCWDNPEEDEYSSDSD